MTLGAPPKSIGIRLDRGGSSSSFEAAETYPRYRFTTEHAVTTNPEPVEHISVEEPSQTLNNHTYQPSTSHIDNSPSSRSKASTPTTPSRQSTHTSPPGYDEEADLELEGRGRQRTRLECIVPPRSRKVSKRVIERNISLSRGGSGSVDGETFLTSESPSPTNSEKEAQDLILEPSPTEFVRGFSERLSEEASLASPAAGVPFPHDHEALPHDYGKSPYDHEALPDDYDFEANKSMTSKRSQDPANPAVARLPAEMIFEIISYLSPFDFNSARHTCRAWMRISLDKNLLARMFRQAGWWASVEKEMRSYLAHSGADEDDFSAVWHLSSLLARECALTAYWTGKGWFPFEQVLETDFSALKEVKVQGNAVPTYAQARGLRDDLQITASVCGRFVLVTYSNQIFVYRLFQTFPGTSEAQDPFKTASIYPVTTIVCPRRVLDVSMDTSCGRYAVAALLDDRMGLVCDLFGSTESSSSRNGFNETPLQPVAVYPYGKCKSQPAYTSVVTPGFLRSNPSNALFGQDSPTLSPRIPPQGTRTRQGYTAQTYPIPIETGPRSIYRALCSNDDPPLSIAICPQRRCVAFGCTSGIELHWVDALTGQDLNRWFPLTAPSDYLFFLPPRQGIDNAKKLRLVSSSGLPGMRGRLRERFNTLRPYDWASSVGVGFGLGGWLDNEASGRNTAENYGSVPLSNGYHIIFTDPIDQRLSLGIDAPGFGLNRMAKKIIFDGPKGILPSLYTAGKDLSWGVRVVASYGDDIWLFTVPEDIFTCEGSGEGEPWSEQYVPSQRLAQVRSMRAAKALLAEIPAMPSVSEDDTSEDQASIWPISLPGIPIATIPGLTEIAIDSRPASFTIWAFASDGTAQAWQITGANARDLRVTKVLSDGSVVEDDTQLMHYDVKLDPDGDVIMEDAPQFTEISLPGLEWTSHTSFDGYMSRSSSLVPTRKPSRRFSVRAGHEAPPTTPVPANSPANPATPILQGVDAALREPSSPPYTISPSLRSASSSFLNVSSPLPSIVEHEIRGIDDIIASNFDEDADWTARGGSAKREALHELVAGLGLERHIRTGRFHPNESIENDDLYGLSYGLGSERHDNALESGQLEIDIL